MSRREREVRVRLDGMMSEAQTVIVYEVVLSQLIGSAGDLRMLNKLRDPRQAVREVAALGRLTFWLEYREILVPDRIARELVERLAREVDEMNEDGESTGGDPSAEHDAMWTFVGLFSDWPAAAEVHDVLWERQVSSEEKACGGR
jgi:hypothetical protein